MANARPSPAIYGGLFLATLSTLMYEILLTRIFSVTMWYHFAFVAVSVALFGMTVGALLVYLLPQFFPNERLNERLFQATLLFSLTMVLSFLVHLVLPFEPAWSAPGLLSVIVTYSVIAVPFTFSGVAVCLVLTRFTAQVSRLYAVDLVGAGIGALSLGWLLNLVRDGPSAVLAVAALSGLGACCFAYALGRRRELALAGAAALLLGSFAAGNAIAAQNNQAVLHVWWVKGQREGRPLYETWNPFSRIRVDGDPDERYRPFRAGLSPSYPGGPMVQQLALTIDATAGTILTKYDGDRETIDFLRYEVTNIAHHVRPDSSVAIIGSGGGSDVLAALAFDQPSITAIEMNGDILDAANGKYGDFTGHLDRQPGVRFVRDEGRSYLARSDRRFDIIQLPFVDTWAATAAGAFALSENSLYTVDAWEMFLNRLTDRGVLSVSRWFYVPRPMEAYRGTALAAEALRGIGVTEPRDHLAVVRAPAIFPDAAVVTILVSREPFSEADLAQLDRVSRDMQFDVVLAPNASANDPRFAEIAAADEPGSVDLGFPGDISPTTDDRPFFFQMVPFEDLFDSSLYGGFNDYLAKPVLVLFSLSITVLLLTGLFIVGPLLLTTKRSALRATAPYMVYFTAIGIAFMLIEISMMQRLIIFLGHPTYALSVVLFALLLSSGIGSLSTERLMSGGAAPRVSLLLPGIALLAVLTIFGFLTPAAIDRFESATTPVRILVAIMLLAPIGLMMGTPFPIGMTAASAAPDSPTAFFWGINGAASVCASVLAVSVSMSWGISIAFWAGCLGYATAATALGFVVLRTRVAAPLPAPAVEVA